MNSDQDRTFRPGLESLEDRFLPSGFPRLVFPTLRSRLVAAPGGSGTPAAVHTIVNPASAATHVFSIVPHHISLGGFDKPGPATVRGVDHGLAVAGLPGPHALASDPGLTTPGLPSYPPSHPATPPPFQVGGLTLSPEGIVSGTFP